MTKHEPAFPFIGQEGLEGNTRMAFGLTKYEEVAARFMAAYLGTRDLVTSLPQPADEMVASWALDAADAFFAELEKRGAK